MNRNYLYISIGILVLIAMGMAWFIFGRQTPTTSTVAPGFGIGDNRSVTIVPEPSGSGEVVSVGEQASRQIIFKIADGPIAGATLLEISRPTTTVARYVKAENGHVFEQPIDVPGAVARAISNTTIPGVTRAVWLQGGYGVMLQYISDGIAKTVYLGFPSAATTSATSTRPVKIQFLPDNIAELAPSPDGTRVAYLLRTQSGVSGYLSRADGSGSTLLFALPLSQVLLSWPAQGALLVTTKSAAAVGGMSFSVNTSSGLVTPILYAEGLTASADRSFSRVLYKTAPLEAAAASSFVRTVASGTDTPLSFDPYPEKCVWSALATSTLYCAAPLEYVPANYLDLWHLGAASVPDSIFSFDLVEGRSSVVAVPGSRDGGEQADIGELSLSPKEDYLLFTSKVGRTLWGARLR